MTPAGVSARIAFAMELWTVMMERTKAKKLVRRRVITNTLTIGCLPEMHEVIKPSNLEHEKIITFGIFFRLHRILL